MCQIRNPVIHNDVLDDASGEGMVIKGPLPTQCESSLRTKPTLADKIYDFLNALVCLPSVKNCTEHTVVNHFSFNFCSELVSEMLVLTTTSISANSHQLLQHWSVLQHAQHQQILFFAYIYIYSHLPGLAWPVAYICFIIVLNVSCIDSLCLSLLMFIITREFWWQSEVERTII